MHAQLERWLLEMWWRKSFAMDGRNVALAVSLFVGGERDRRVHGELMLVVGLAATKGETDACTT